MHELDPIKFILYKGEFLIARVRFHKDMLPEGYDKSDVAGGGFAEMDNDNKVIKVRGKSEDFGYYDNVLIHTCKMPDRLKEYTIEEIKEPDEL